MDWLWMALARLRRGERVWLVWGEEGWRVL